MSNETDNSTVRVDGGSREMPDKGTGTGLNGDTYGADLGQDATNVIRSLVKDTQSDPVKYPSEGLSDE